ncbi:hypothetical protein BMS3Abin03_00885 [bacterium BMS3Abin03]|nr:hypothetical protein BMS3Abin03_00885 [bacterium BMS3Abin03]
MKKVEVFSKKLNKSFTVSLADSCKEGKGGTTYTDLYTGKADVKDQSLKLINDWDSWVNQGWSNWGAICV